MDEKTIRPGPNSWSAEEHVPEGPPETYLAPPVPTAFEMDDYLSAGYERDSYEDLNTRGRSRTVIPRFETAPWHEDHRPSHFLAGHVIGGTSKPTGSKDLTDKPLPAKPNKDSPATRVVKAFFSRKRSGSEASSVVERSQSIVKKEPTIEIMDSTELFNYAQEDETTPKARVVNKRSWSPLKRSISPSNKEPLGQQTGTFHDNYSSPKKGKDMSKPVPPVTVKCEDEEETYEYFDPSVKEVSENSKDRSGEGSRGGVVFSDERPISADSIGIARSTDGDIIYGTSERLSPAANDSVARLRVVNIEGSPHRVSSVHGAIETATVASKTSSDHLQLVVQAQSSPFLTPQAANIWKNDPRVGNTLPPWSTESVVASSSVYSPFSPHFNNDQAYVREVKQDENKTTPPRPATAPTPETTPKLPAGTTEMEQRLHAHIDQMHASILFHTSVRNREAIDNISTRLDQLTADLDRVSMNIGYFRQGQENERKRQTQDIVNRIDEISSRLGDYDVGDILRRASAGEDVLREYIEEVFAKFKGSLDRLNHNMELVDQNSNELSDRVGNVNVAQELGAIMSSTIHLQSAFDNMFRSQNTTSGLMDRRMNDLIASIGNEGLRSRFNHGQTNHNFSRLSGDLSNLRVEAAESAAEASSLAVREVDEMLVHHREEIMSDINREIMANIRGSVSETIARHLNGLRRNIRREIPRTVNAAMSEHRHVAEAEQTLQRTNSQHQRESSTGTVEGLRGSDVIPAENRATGALHRTRSQFESRMQHRGRSAPHAR